MRIFLLVLSVLSLLLAAHRFSLAEGTGQLKGGLFLLLIGIQLLIAAALVGDHRDDRAPKSPASTEKNDRKDGMSSAVHATEKQEAKH